MTCHRRYTFRYAQPWDQGGYSRILSHLQRACYADWWFTDPAVDGEQEGVLEFSFTVAGRDGWWVHQRAMDLAVDCFYVVGLREHNVPVPTWVKLPPHTKRGRYRIVSSNGL